MPNIQEYLERYDNYKTKKANWNNSWQLVGEYIHTRKQDFTGREPEGSFLNEEIFDTTAITARKRSSSALIGMLWNGKVKLKPTRDLEVLGNFDDYFSYITEVVNDQLNHPNAGLGLALNEYSNDVTSFGTSGVGVFEGEMSPLIFRPYSVQNMAIDEGLNGRIDTIFTEYKWTAKRLVQEFDLNMVSEKTRGLIRDGKIDEKVSVLNIVEPRKEFDREKRNVQNFPYTDIWIEIDAKHMIAESGFHEIPISVGRLEKRIGEIYGRGWGMQAMPDVLMINQMVEDYAIIAEKLGEPPLGLMSDGDLGAQEIDTSSRALNVFRASGRLEGQSPIFPLYTVGDPSAILLFIQELRERISDHFNVDILLDFMNQKEMTLGETQIRNNLRFQALQGIISRQIAELFNPVITRSVNLLARMGLLGANPMDQESVTMLRRQDRVSEIIPEEIIQFIASGKPWFDIIYNTPATRMQNAESLNGSLQLIQVAASLGPEAMDNVDIDEAMRYIADQTGVPDDIIRNSSEIEDIRDARGQAIQQQQLIENSETIANTEKTANEARNAA